MLGVIHIVCNTKYVDERRYMPMNPLVILVGLLGIKPP